MEQSKKMPTYSVGEKTSKFIFCIEQSQKLYSLMYDAVATIYGEDYADKFIEDFSDKHSEMQKEIEKFMMSSIMDNLYSLDKENEI